MHVIVKCIIDFIRLKICPMIERMNLEYIVIAKLPVYKDAAQHNFGSSSDSGKCKTDRFEYGLVV